MIRWIHRLAAAGEMIVIASATAAATYLVGRAIGLGV